MTPSQLMREQAQAALAAAAAERDTIQANLLDLDGSFGRRLLAGAELTGGSARRWEAASAALTALWDTFSAYSAVIDRAAGLLAGPGRPSTARLGQVGDLLGGPSVRLATRPALGQRELTAGGEVRLSLAATVQLMRRTFAEVAPVLTAAESVWNEISDGLGRVDEALQAARQQAAGMADADLSGALTLTGAAVRDLRSLLNADPLALWQAGRVDTAQLDRLRQQAAAAGARARQLAALRDDAGRRVAEVSAAVAAAQQAWQDATAARQRVAARVVGGLDPLPGVAGLAARQGALGALLAAGRLTRLGTELDALGSEAADTTHRLREAERAAAGLIGRRDELRGLLDAYRAKAARLGAVEDLDARYRQARDVLWSAPCDLAAAAAAVTGYQQAVLSLGARQERA